MPNININNALDAAGIAFSNAEFNEHLERGKFRGGQWLGDKEAAQKRFTELSLSSADGSFGVARAESGYTSRSSARGGTSKGAVLAFIRDMRMVYGEKVGMEALQKSPFVDEAGNVNLKRFTLGNVRECLKSAKELSVAHAADSAWEKLQVMQEFKQVSGTLKTMLDGINKAPEQAAADEGLGSRLNAFVTRKMDLEMKMAELGIRFADPETEMQTAAAKFKEAACKFIMQKEPKIDRALLQGAGWAMVTCVFLAVRNSEITSAEDINTYIKKEIDGRELANTVDTLESIDNALAFKAANGEGIVNIESIQRPTLARVEDPSALFGRAKDEFRNNVNAQVRNFAADLVFDERTYEADMMRLSKAHHKGDNTKAVFMRNLDLICLLAGNTAAREAVAAGKEADMILKIVDTLREGLSDDKVTRLYNIAAASVSEEPWTRFGAIAQKAGLATLLGAGVEVIDTLMNAINAATGRVGNDGEISMEAVRGAIIRAIFERELFAKIDFAKLAGANAVDEDTRKVFEMLKGGYAGIESAVDAQVQEGAAKLQSDISAAIRKMHESESQEITEKEPIFKNAAERLKRSDAAEIEAIKNMSLKDVIDFAGRPEDKSDSAFLIKVMKRYFSRVGPLDKRAMAAAAIRYYEPPADARDEAAAKMAAAFKGAGPIMQKMLQSVSFTSSEVLSKACEDMKSRLAPIPQEVVEARLLETVRNSNGAISSIKVEQSLGAASVGQAFLCTMVKGNGDHEAVVVKILRPDVANRAKREEGIFDEAAEELGESMQRTFKGRLETIVRELDLTIEAENIRNGIVYDKPFAAVKSVKVHREVAPAPNVLVLEKCPGNTVDSMVSAIDVMLKKTAPESKEDINERTRILYSELPKRYFELCHVQRHLVQAASNWVTEALYGSGFFHGDMHAGNMMGTAEQFRVLDFGNALRISNDERTHIMRAVAGVLWQNTDMFIENFTALLSADGRNDFEKSRAYLKDMIGAVLKKGDASYAGTKVFAIISMMQKRGVEMPQTIYNFSQSLVRLQNTIDDVNRILASAREALGKRLVGDFGSPEDDIKAVFGLGRKEEPSQAQKADWKRVIDYRKKHNLPLSTDPEREINSAFKAALNARAGRETEKAKDAFSAVIARFDDDYTEEKIDVVGKDSEGDESITQYFMARKGVRIMRGFEAFYRELLEEKERTGVQKFDENALKERIKKLPIFNETVGAYDLDTIVRTWNAVSRGALTPQFGGYSLAKAMMANRDNWRSVNSTKNQLLEIVNSKDFEQLKPLGNQRLDFFAVMSKVIGSHVSDTAKAVGKGGLFAGIGLKFGSSNVKI